MILFFLLFGALAQRIGLDYAADVVSVVGVLSIGFVVIWWRMVFNESKMNSVTHFTEHVSMGK